MTTREARTLLATLPLAAHALIRAVCAALGRHKEPTRVDALTRWCPTCNPRAFRVPDGLPRERTP